MEVYLDFLTPKREYILSSGNLQCKKEYEHQVQPSTVISESLYEISEKIDDPDPF
jgi:hypothetical protein